MAREQLYLVTFEKVSCAYAKFNDLIKSQNQSTISLPAEWSWKVDAPVTNLTQRGQPSQCFVYGQRSREITRACYQAPASIWNCQCHEFGPFKVHYASLYHFARWSPLSSKTIWQKRPTSIYGSSQSCIIQIFDLFMKMFWGQTRLPAREHFLQGDVNCCSDSRTCQTKWSVLSLSIWRSGEFASWCCKWVNPRNWSGIKSGLQQFHWRYCVQSCLLYRKWGCQWFCSPFHLSRTFAIACQRIEKMNWKN